MKSKRKERAATSIPSDEEGGNHKNMQI